LLVSPIITHSYALDIGRKTRATKQMNIRNGCFVGRFPPYGYLKSREDKHKLVRDEYAAAIVCRIFEMAANGNSVSVILKRLDDDGILPPRRYFHSVGLATEKEAGGHIHWNRGTLYAILRNRMYSGDMVQGKNKTYSYIEEKLPESEWVITENTHAPIVSRELFADVQSFLKKPTGKITSPYDTPTTENIFLSKVFCGHCGYAMRRARENEKRYVFRCATRVQFSKDDCIPVSIGEDVLKASLLETLRVQAAAFADIDGAKTVTTTDNADLRSVQAELDRNGRFLKGLYESLVSGDITDNEYREMKQTYETRIAELSERERQMREANRVALLEASARKKAATELGAVGCVTDLTAEVIGGLIEKILVYDNDRVEIKFRFRDETVEIGGTVS
jgi:hypothetical protein